MGDVTLSMDGTKVLANASRHSAVSHGHAQGQMQLLEEQFAQLLAKAEQADSAPLEDGLSVPEEVARRKDRLGKLREATAQIEARARERHRGEMAEFEQKVARREAQRAAGRKPRGREPKRPVEGVCRRSDVLSHWRNNAMKRLRGRIPLVNTFGKASLHPVDGTPGGRTAKQGSI